ncbi:hypothetical protein [Litorivita pollutaquae]|uniref:hypothetical protein n=1 Tax=Litorivita pollutaquae TaxID=2200892 RepID=UPI001F1A021A|nr:hypothetical protein [Litorivita pollutaquae]
MRPPSAPPEGRGPVFLERKTYRARRLMDGARVLPVLGMVLFLLPALWPQPVAEIATSGGDAAAGGGLSAGPVETSAAMLYVFGIWALLILVSVVMARGLARAEFIGAAQAGKTGSGAGAVRAGQED